MLRILIADDQADVLEALRLLLKGEGFETVCVTSPSAVVRSADETDFDAVLIDLNYTRDTTSGQEGLDLLKQLQSIDNTLPVIVMTAWGSVELAVEAMKRGARDFIEKPWDNARLLTTLKTQIELGQALRKGALLEAENRILRDDKGEENSAPTLLAESLAMRSVLDMIRRIAPSDANVLITGENGTGKDVVARTLHNLSQRAGKQIVIINAGAFSDGVFESELFGHVRGAFTDAKTDRVGRFELADNGTLFLDEIANMSQSLQTKLLRVLETGEFERVGSSRTRRVNVRVLSATNANVQEEIAQGRFRQDLFFRLNTIEIHLPPLRERKEDITLLARHFLQRHNRHYRRQIKGFTDEALKALSEYSWPGNVRELNHMIERAVLLASGDVINAHDLGLSNSKAASKETHIEEMNLEDVERLLIQKTLARYDGNANRAAEALGLSRSALYRRLQKYGL